MNMAKKQGIMKAAEALFRHGRFHEITMDDVAREAGVGKGTLYRYFKGKDDLFFEVALSGYDEMCDMVRTESRRSSDVRACLIRVCRRVSEFHRARRQLIHMMQVEERRAMRKRGRDRELWLQKRGRLVDAITSILEEGWRQGAIRSDLPLKVQAVFLLGMLRAGGRESRSDPSLQVHHEHVVDFFLHGASTRAPSEVSS